jgi:uncharacterized protein DUF4349
MALRFRSVLAKTGRVLVLFGVLFGLVSCGEQAGVKNSRAAREATKISPPATAAMVQEAANGFSITAGGEARNDKVKSRFVYFQETAAETAQRIIYTADLSLVVKNMAETEAEIGKLLKQFGGYVGESNVDRRQGENLVGRWKVRAAI